MQKGRPPQLSLSPSDPAIHANAKAVVPVERRVLDDDRGVLSEVRYDLAILISRG